MPQTIQSNSRTRNYPDPFLFFSRVSRGACAAAHLRWKYHSGSLNKSLDLSADHFPRYPHLFFLCSNSFDGHAAKLMHAKHKTPTQTDSFQIFTKDLVCDPTLYSIAPTCAIATHLSKKKEQQTRFCWQLPFNEVFLLVLVNRGVLIAIPSRFCWSIASF